MRRSCSGCFNRATAQHSLRLTLRASRSDASRRVGRPHCCSIRATSFFETPAFAPLRRARQHEVGRNLRAATRKALERLTNFCPLALSPVNSHSKRQQSFFFLQPVYERHALLSRGRHLEASIWRSRVWRLGLCT